MARSRPILIPTRHGGVSATWDLPAGAAGSSGAAVKRAPAPGAAVRAALALAHGAGVARDHPALDRLARALAEDGFAVLRFNFPYTEAGRKAPDREPVLTAVWADVWAWSGSAAARVGGPGLPRFAGGRSMGGRMASVLAARPPEEREGFDPAGLIFFAYPLHPAGREDALRVEHLARIESPMLFLSGDRDPLARIDLLRREVRRLGRRARLHVLRGADHGYEVLKRSGRDAGAVAAEASAAAARWRDDDLARGGRS